MREHIVISFWFGIVGSLVPKDNFRCGVGVRVFLRIGYNRTKCGFRKRVLP